MLNFVRLSILFTAFISQAQAADFKIDRSHTTVQFIVGHLGFSQTVGRFNDFSGKFNLTDLAKGQASVEFEIQAASVDSSHEPRDKHLKSPDFFNAKQFPIITFKGSEYKGGDSKGTLRGELNLLGVTKRITFDVVKIGEGKSPFGDYRAGFNATTTIKRSEFGMSYAVPGVTDEVQINVFVEGIRVDG